MSTIYVSGPMTGIPQFNFPMFDSLSAYLRGLGHDVISPADHDRVEFAKRGLGVVDVPGFAEGDVVPYFAAVEDMELDGMLGWDIIQIVQYADSIVMLPGWENSTGAAHERYVAEVVGKTVYIATEIYHVLPRHEHQRNWEIVRDPEQKRLTCVVKYADRQKLEQSPWPRAGWGPAMTAAAEAEAESLRDTLVADLERPISRYDKATRNWLHRGDGICSKGVDPMHTEDFYNGDEVVYDDQSEHLALANEVRVVNATTGGEKGSKLARFDLIPPRALELLAEHYGRGSRKYDDRNWEKGYDWGLSFAALNRHLWAFWNGEDMDAETGSPHLVAVAWHAFTLLTFMETHPELDTRSVKSFTSLLSQYVREAEAEIRADFQAHANTLLWGNPEGDH